MFKHPDTVADLVGDCVCRQATIHLVVEDIDLNLAQIYDACTVIGETRKTTNVTKVVIA